MGEKVGRRVLEGLREAIRIYFMKKNVFSKNLKKPYHVFLTTTSLTIEKVKIISLGKMETISFPPRNTSDSTEKAAKVYTP